jgi:hypothetical protein
MNKNDNPGMSSPFHKLVTGSLSIQVIATVFAAVVYAVSANNMSALSAELITSCVFIPVYMMMIYTFFWGVGERERNMIKYGRMEEDKTRGLRAGVYAAIPVGIIAVLASFMLYFADDSGIVGVFRLCAAPLILIVNYFLVLAPFALLLVAVFPVAAAYFGYRNGMNVFRLWDKLIYKDGVNKSARYNRRRRR